MKPCKVCGTETEFVMNIKLNAVPICEGCANQIMQQQIRWLIAAVNHYQGEV